MLNGHYAPHIHDRAPYALAAFRSPTGLHYPDKNSKIAPLVTSQQATGVVFCEKRQNQPDPLVSQRCKIFHRNRARLGSVNPK